MNKLQYLSIKCLIELRKIDMIVNRIANNLTLHNTMNVTCFSVAVKEVSTRQGIERLFSVIMSDCDFMYFIFKVKPECDQRGYSVS
jgi:hypothetical protein